VVSLHAEEPPLHAPLIPDPGVYRPRPVTEERACLIGIAALVSTPDSSSARRPTPRGTGVWESHFTLQGNPNTDFSGADHAFQCTLHGLRHWSAFADHSAAGAVTRYEAQRLHVAANGLSDHTLLMGFRQGLKHLAD
jgi:hypothetical protein